MTPTIRAARLNDAPTLARLGAETFVATFGHLYPPADLEAFLTKHHALPAYEDLLGDPDWGVLIAEAENGVALGYAVAGPCSLPVPDMPENSGELGRIYLIKDAQRTGLGARLLETALEFLRSRYQHVYLSVYAENIVAQKLYRRYGFEKIHDYFFQVGEHLDPEWIMELKARG